VTVTATVVRIVDDDESIRRSLRGLVESIGLSVVTYSSAQEFLAVDRLDTPGARCSMFSFLAERTRFAAATCRYAELCPSFFSPVGATFQCRFGAMKEGALEFLNQADQRAGAGWQRYATLSRRIAWRAPNARV